MAGKQLDPKLFGQVWAEYWVPEVEMGIHRADDGTLQGTPFEPPTCPKCQRVGWWLNDWCLGCGYIWPSVPLPIVKTTDPDNTPHAPIDVMRDTVDGWSDELRKEAYKYLFNRYDIRIDKCR